MVLEIQWKAQTFIIGLEFLSISEQLLISNFTAKVTPFLTKIFIIHVWLFCLHVCLGTMCVQYLKRPGEGIGPPGTGIIGNSELSAAVGFENSLSL